MREDYQDSVNNSFDVQNTQGVEINALEAKRKNTDYTNKDLGWETGKFDGDIYMSVSDATHNRIVNHHNNPNDAQYNLPESGYPGTSGFFTNEETASKSFTTEGKFDSVALGHDLQQAPYYNENLAAQCEENGIVYNPEYNGHLDCFRVNHEKMQEHFGTTDFHAAMSKCTENSPWGNGGGDQGYNPYTNEMINKGCLEYVPENSRTCDVNVCKDYSERKDIAKGQAGEVNDYIEKNNIKGEPNQRIGHNELMRSNEISTNAASTASTAAHNSSDPVSSGGGARAPDVIDTSNDPAKRGKVESAPETKFNSEDNVKRGKIESSPNTEPSPESEPKRGRVANTDVDTNTFKVANDTNNAAVSSSAGMSTNSIT